MNNDHYYILTGEAEKFYKKFNDLYNKQVQDRHDKMREWCAKNDMPSKYCADRNGVTGLHMPEDGKIPKNFKKSKALYGAIVPKATKEGKKIKEFFDSLKITANYADIYEHLNCDYCTLNPDETITWTRCLMMNNVCFLISGERIDHPEAKPSTSDYFSEQKYLNFHKVKK